MTGCITCDLVMVALWNRAEHYIFALWFLLSFFPRLISAVGDWMSTILPHMMMMMRGFVERVISSHQMRYRSAKQAGLQMSSKRQRGESCSSQSGW